LAIGFKFSLSLKIKEYLSVMNNDSNSSYKFLVVDDHDSVLNGTVGMLQQQYPNAKIVTAQTTENARQKASEVNPDLALLDLSLPEKTQGTARTEAGFQLLRDLMDWYPNLNIVVQSSFIKALRRFKPSIDQHSGGFAIVDKSQSLQEMLTLVDLALQGLTCTPRELRQNIIEVKPEWLELLALAYQEGLQDSEIAKRMNVAERTVGNYWKKIKDVLEVYPNKGQNIRIQTEMRAREEGLID
jgi:DNA-binding NarL/FixJ family response regulator